jgi:hypothetical protein
MTQNKLRIKGVGASNPVDADAQAFITAAGITDTTQKSAINTLVVNLKAYGIWTKMKAIYPLVGGTSSTHKWNLKDPRDLDAAFRLVFNGGWTHSSTGATPNGTNAYADTKFIPSTNTALNSYSQGFYSRTNIDALAVDMGGVGSVQTGYMLFLSRYSNQFSNVINSLVNYTNSANTDSRGFFVGNRTASNVIKNYKNGSLLTTGSVASITNCNGSIWIGAFNNNGGGQYYTNRQYAFSYIGDGLTDTEAANFYTAVQAFQTTLGRSIGTQTVSDPDAQAFINAAAIDDQVQATAINNLVTGLKADSIWTKMKALYPFVGGTASSHKFNLKDPRDLDVAFRLVFNGGLTHSSTGIKGNGTNGYFDTFLNPSTVFNSASGGSMFTYIRNNTGTGADLGAFQPTQNYRFQLTTRDTSNGISGAALSNNRILETNLDSRGFWGVTRPPSSSTYHLIKNTTSSSNTDTFNAPNSKLFGLVLAVSSSPLAGTYSDHEFAFTCIADGLTTTEAQTLRTRVITFNTSLNRNV